MTLKSIHPLAAELARIVPDLAADSLINREAIILGILQNASEPSPEFLNAYRNQVISECAQIVRYHQGDRDDTVKAMLEARQ